MKTSFEKTLERVVSKKESLLIAEVFSEAADRIHRGDNSLCCNAITYAAQTVGVTDELYGYCREVFRDWFYARSHEEGQGHTYWWRLQDKEARYLALFLLAEEYYPIKEV